MFTQQQPWRELSAGAVVRTPAGASWLLLSAREQTFSTVCLWGPIDSTAPGQLVLTVPADALVSVVKAPRNEPEFHLSNHFHLELLTETEN